MKRVLLSVSLCLAAGAVFAADPPSVAASGVPVTKDELGKRARAEGGLVVMAQACGVPKKEVTELANKSRTDTLALAKNFSLRFDASAYRGHAGAGADDAREFLSHSPNSGLAYDKRCAQVKDKIKRKMQP